MDKLPKNLQDIVTLLDSLTLEERYQILGYFCPCGIRIPRDEKHQQGCQWWHQEKYKEFRASRSACRP